MNGYPFLYALPASAITGVTVPIRGATPVALIASTTEYSASIAWSPVAVTFAAGTAYTATITLIPNAGYTLTGVIANYFTVIGATTTNSLNAGVITALFPATQALSSTATLTSTTGTVSVGGTVSENITNIPNATTVTELRAAITPAAYATFEVYDADGATVATTLATGKKVIVTAQDGTTKVTYTLTVNAAPDIIVPVITLIGSTTVNLTNGAGYTDAGATASDNIDGDLSDDIVVTISNNVNAGTTLDTAVAGTYTYHYNVSDIAGNAAQEKTRTVVVANVVNTPTNTITNKCYRYVHGWCFNATRR
jgi:hypothetical protein